MWNGDLAFTEEQLPAWREAERTAGLASQHTSNPKQRAPARAPEPLAAELAVKGYICRRTFEGQLQHFEFETGDLGTGYYDTRFKAMRPAAAAAPRQIVLANLVPEHGCKRAFFHQQSETNEAARRLGKKARRARHPDGGRRLVVFRQETAITHAAAIADQAAAETCATSDRSWAKHGLWAIDTAEVAS